MAWLGMRGLWLFLVPFMVVGEVQADCGPADDPVITCAGNTMGAVPIDPGIDTTVNVDPGATVSNSPEVIDFSPGSATNAVNNYGTIERTTNGTAIAGGTGPETINNYETITGGVSLDAGIDTFTNQSGATVTGSVNLAAGIDTFTNHSGSTVTGNVTLGDDDDFGTNDGTIDLDFRGDDGDDMLTNNGHIGQDFQGRDGNDTLINHGTVGGDLTGFFGDDTITNTKDITQNLNAGGGDDIVTNSGFIGGDLNVEDGNDIVNNTSTGEITGNLLGDANADNITNWGHVGGNLDGGNGQNTIYNAGFIGGSLLGGDGNDTFSLDMGSTIGVTLDGGDGTDILNLLGTGTLDHPVVNMEILNSQGDWTLGTNVDFNNANITSGTLVLQNIFLTADTTIANGATLMGTGTITGILTNHGRLSPGNSIGTLTINGAYVQEAGSTLEIEVSPTNGVSDVLDITGTADLQGGTLSILPLGYIPPSHQYTIIDTTAGISGTFNQIPNTSAFSFDIDYSPNQVTLLNVTVDFAANARTPNQLATGTYLNQIYPTATPELEANLTTLGSIPDTTAYQAALDQLHPEFFDAFTGKTFLENYWFNSTLGARRNHCWWQEPEQAPRLRFCGQRFATWSQIDGSTITRHGGDQHISYDAEVINLAVGGFWAPANGRASVQAALGYSHDQLTMTDRGTGSSHRATVGLQGRKYFGPFALAGLFSGGYKWSESDRTITYSTVAQEASASFQSLIASAEARLEYEVFNTNGWYGLTYGGFGTDYVRTGSFSESYAEGLGLAVDEFDATRYGLLAGGAIKRAFPMPISGIGGLVVPEVSLEYMNFLDSVDRTLTGRLLGAQSQGPPLTVTGRSPDERLRLGAWLTTQQSPSLGLSTGFLASFLDGTQTLGGALRLVYRFN